MIKEKTREDSSCESDSEEEIRSREKPKKNNDKRDRGRSGERRKEEKILGVSEPSNEQLQSESTEEIACSKAEDEIPPDCGVAE